MVRCKTALNMPIALLRNTRIRLATLAAISLAIILTLQSTASVHATAFGPLDSPRLLHIGALLEPIADARSFRTITGSQNTDEPAAFHSIPEPSFEFYESLDKSINQSKRRNRKASDDFFGVDGGSSLPKSLTALERTQKMAEDGYWLENDQWSDFKAIALASYRPELRYWLGRDRWSAFGSLDIGSEPIVEAGGETLAPRNDVTNATYSAAGVYNGNQLEGSATGEKHRGKNKAVEALSTYELLLSMAKKISKQPLFYLAILGGAIVLLLAFKRHSVG
jgi:hypothetical protein